MNKQKPEHIFITGPHGSGKSTLAKKLSKEKNLSVLDLDKIVNSGKSWRRAINNLKIPHIIEGAQLMLDKKPRDNNITILEGSRDELIKRLLRRGWQNAEGRWVRGEKYRDQATEIIDWSLGNLDQAKSRWGLLKNAQSLNKTINKADLSFPILMTQDGKVIDGMHRLLKAHSEGRDTIPVKVVPQMILDMVEIKKNQSYSGQIYTSDSGKDYSIKDLHKIFSNKNDYDYVEKPLPIIQNNLDAWGSGKEVERVLNQMNKKELMFKLGFLKSAVKGVGGDYKDPNNIYDVDAEIKKSWSGIGRSGLKALLGAAGTALLHHKGYNKLKYLSGAATGLYGLDALAHDREATNNCLAKLSLVGEDGKWDPQDLQMLVENRPRYVPDALFYKKEYKDKFKSNMAKLKTQNPKLYNKTMNIIKSHYPKYDIERD